MSISPVDTGRVTPGIPPQMSNLGTFDPSSGSGSMPAVTPGQPGQPIMRPSFLQSFLASLPSALAGGLATNGDPRFPFGTGLTGALHGIEEQKRYNAQQAIQQQGEARQNALAQSTLQSQASTRDYQTAETNRLNQLTPL